MNLQRLSTICLAKAGATQDFKWGGNTVFSVGQKMFAIASPSGPGPFGRLAFKVDDQRFLELTDRPGIVPAPYLARAKWIALTDPQALGDAALEQLLEDAYQLVFAKLTKKLQREINPARA